MALVNNLPERIVAARVLAGMNQAQLAQVIRRQSPEVKLGKDTISNIERGKRAYVQRHELKAIAEACDLPMAFFDEDFWVLDDLANAMDTLPGELLSQYTPQELLISAFAALVQKHRAGDTDLSASSLDYRLGVLERVVSARLTGSASALVDAFAGPETGETQAAVNLSRGVKQAAADQVEPAGRESEAAGDTRDEADATPEESPAPREAKQ